MLEKRNISTNVNGGGTDRLLLRIAGSLAILILFMTFTIPAFGANYRPTIGGAGNDISLTLSGPSIAAWKGTAMFTATASDNDYYSDNNWISSNTISDTLIHSWDFGGMGTPGQPNGSYTGVQNMVPGAYTVQSIVNDTAPAVYSPNTGSRDDAGSKIAQMDVAVVRTDINTGLADTGYSNDQENAAPGAVLREYSDNNDLVPVQLSYTLHSSILNGCKVRLQGSGPIRIWENADKTGFISIMGMMPPNTGPTTWTLDANGDCGMPDTIYVEGTGRGSATLELVFYRMVGSTEYEVTRDTVKFTVVSVHVNKVEFTSDHNVMTDWTTDYASAGGNLFSPRGWIRGGANNPISHSQGATVTANVTVCVQPANTTFSLQGTGQTGLSFTTVNNIVSTGADQVVAVTATTALPAKVDVIDSNIVWSITQSGSPVTTVTHTSGPHEIYVTWGTPIGSGITQKRISWACQQMTNATSKANAAEKISIFVNDSPGFGDNNVYNSWEILDSNTPSDCVTLADLCAEALRKVGIPAGVNQSYGTHDGSGGFPNVSSNTCRSTTMSYAWDRFNSVFWEVVAGFDNNRYEGFFTITDGVTKAYTVVPLAGPFVNQDYYYLEVMRATTDTQSWLVYLQQTQNGITKNDGDDAGALPWSTPDIP